MGLLKIYFDLDYKRKMESFSFNESLKDLEFYDDKLNDELISDYSVINLIEVFYAVAISIFGFIVNIIVCILVFKKGKTQTSLNVFLVTLAIYDMLFCLFYLIVSPTYYLFNAWIFGAYLCYGFIFVPEFNEYYTIIAICTSICLFSCRKVNLKLAYVTIIIISCCAVIMAFVGNKYFLIDVHYSCGDIFSLVYLQLKLLINIVLPLVVIILSIILRFLFKSDSNPSSRLLLVLMGIYVLLYTPWAALRSFPMNAQLYIYFYKFCYFLSHLTVVYKPIVYYKMDKKLKNEFLKLISQCFKPKRQEVYNMQ